MTTTTALLSSGEILVLDRASGELVTVTKDGVSPVLDLAFAAIELGARTVLAMDGDDGFSRWELSPAVGVQDGAGEWRWLKGWPRRMPTTPAPGRWLAVGALGALLCYDPIAGTVAAVLPPGVQDPNRPADEDGPGLLDGGSDVVPVTLVAPMRPGELEVLLPADLPAESPGHVLAAWLGRRYSTGVVGVCIDDDPTFLPGHPACDYLSWFEGEWARPDSLPS